MGIYLTSAIPVEIPVRSDQLCYAVYLICYLFFLINGLPRKKVVLSRGIYQGDSFSSYIFIMCNEVLSGLCNSAQEDRTLKRMIVARSSPQINHLLFVDDAIFFLQANNVNCTTLKIILRQHPDILKQWNSAINFSRKKPVFLKEMVKEELQIEKEGGAGKYLSFPENFVRRKHDMFSSVVDRIKQKSRGWSNKFFSLASFSV